jgi:ankyrin repeat protein
MASESFQLEQLRSSSPLINIVSASSQTSDIEPLIMRREKALVELKKLSHQPNYFRLLSRIFLEDLPPVSKGTVVHRKERTIPFVDAKQKVRAKLLTPLQELIESTSFKNDEKMHLLSLLLQAGASFKGIFSNNETLLHIAARYNARDIVDFLLSQGMPVDVARIDKAPPLYIAIYNQHVSIVQRLLLEGAKTDYKTKDGKTLLEVAQQKGSFEIVECLRSVMQSSDSASTAPLGTALSSDTSLSEPFVKLDVNAAVACGVFSPLPSHRAEPQTIDQAFMLDNTAHEHASDGFKFRTHSST